MFIGAMALTLFGPVPQSSAPLPEQFLFVLVPVGGLFVIETLIRRLEPQSREQLRFVEASYMVLVCIAVAVIALLRRR